MTQQDIARILGISRGTVVRALTGRMDVNSATRRLVLDKAVELGYVPNRMARRLQRSRPLLIVVACPSDHFFWQQVLKGVEQARAELEEFGTTVICYPVNKSNLFDSHGSILENKVREGLDGLAVAALVPGLIRPLIQRAHELGVRVSTFNTDCSDSPRLFYVGPDNVKAGRLAANVLGVTVNAGGRVAAISLPEAILGMGDRLKGFRRALAERYAELNLCSVEILPMPQSIEEIDVERALERLLDEHEPDGIYFTFSVGIDRIAKVLRARGLVNRIKIVCHDLFEEMVELIRQGVITATIGQDPHYQGYQAVMGLYRYITDGVTPEQIQFTNLDVILAENLDDHLI